MPPASLLSPEGSESQTRCSLQGICSPLVSLRPLEKVPRRCSCEWNIILTAINEIPLVSCQLTWSMPCLFPYFFLYSHSHLGLFLDSLFWLLNLCEHQTFNYCSLFLRIFFIYFDFFNKLRTLSLSTPTIKIHACMYVSGTYIVLTRHSCEHVKFTSWCKKTPL